MTNAAVPREVAINVLAARTHEVMIDRYDDRRRCGREFWRTTTDEAWIAQHTGTDRVRRLPSEEYQADITYPYHELPADLQAPYFNDATVVVDVVIEHLERGLTPAELLEPCAQFLRMSWRERMPSPTYREVDYVDLPEGMKTLYREPIRFALAALGVG